MKLNLAKTLIIFFGLLSVSSFAKTHVSHEHETSPFDSKDLLTQNVIVCSGQYAYAYHSRDNCPGLNNCQAQLFTVSEYDAVNKYSRKACCRCWQNVSNNCHDDNPTNSGGRNTASSDAGYAYIALAFVATGAILLSNEVYVAPTYSFQRSSNVSNSISGTLDFKNLSSFGWTIQFRKKFPQSNLEYGAGFIDYKYPLDNNFNYNPNKRIWRANINYIFNVFYDKLPERFNIFLGPSANFEFDRSKPGFGAVAGCSYRLFDRLKVDIRHELTSTTNQTSIGLQFLYQKKYFWIKD
jgi:hypothetical protein